MATPIPAQNQWGWVINARNAEEFFMPNQAWPESWQYHPVLKNQVVPWTTDPNFLVPTPKMLPIPNGFDRAVSPIFLNSSTPYISEEQRKCLEEGNSLSCGSLRSKPLKVYKIIPFSARNMRGGYLFDGNGRRVSIYSHIAICVDNTEEEPRGPTGTGPRGPRLPRRKPGKGNPKGPYKDPTCGVTLPVGPFRPVEVVLPACPSTFCVEGRGYFGPDGQELPVCVGRRSNRSYFPR